MSEYLDCPLPIGAYDHVVMGHGAGGRLTQQLLDQLILPAFDDPTNRALEDAAIVPVAQGRIAITTDSFVVSPRTFPGGDIGKLAACGTINDLAASGAIPQWMSVALVLEEGLPLAELARYLRSLAAVCRAADVNVIAGDTKVVERGKGDGVFITTTGVGVVPESVQLSWHAARPGDRIIVTGPIGDHGIAILAQRQSLELQPSIESDCAPLHELARSIIAAAGPHLRGMRDPTRGGVASALNELAVASHIGVRISERAIPLQRGVRAACEILGLDPLYIACEGRLVVVVAPEGADAVLGACGNVAAMIGEALSDHPTHVVLQSALGTTRIVPLLSGDQLPRIC